MFFIILLMSHRRFEAILEMVCELSDNDAFTSEFINKYRSHLFGTLPSPTITDIYDFLFPALSPPSPPVFGAPPTPTSPDTKRRRLSASNSELIRWTCSSYLISMEDGSLAFRNLQFKHLSMFPHTTCPICSTPFCFQCGEIGWHHGWSCMDWLHQLIQRHGGSNVGEPGTRPMTPPKRQSPRLNPFLNPSSNHTALSYVSCVQRDVETLRWKVAFSKSCPQCHVLIQRDDGCNKVDCTFCGYRFCWVCRQAWSEGCGFYQCQSQKSQNLDMESVKEHKDEKDVVTELGVPDIARIERRYS
jgi:hypothetical protein